MVRRRAGLTEDDDDETTRRGIASALEEHVPDPADRERIGAALLSLLGVEPAPTGGRDVLFPAWRHFFERIAERGPTVLVFEDLQWADSGLLDFIDHLIDWSRGLTILVVTLARPELFDRRPDWGGGRRHFTGLALDPLSDDEVRGLLAGLVPGLPEAGVELIVKRAEGIPLYAVETVRSLLASGRIERVGEAYRPVGDLSQLEVPESLRSLIASRLDSLDPGDRSLLQDAAVLGQVVSSDALEAVTTSGSADLSARLRTLVRRELLDVESDPRSPERGQYKFVQSLIREVAYGMLARRDRRGRHLAAARYFEAQGDDEVVGALASHYLAAHAASDEGAEADAIAAQARLALGAAAARAAALGAHDQAIHHIDQALAVTTDLRERASLLERAAESASADARADASDYADGALRAYRQVGDDVSAARASAGFAKTLIEKGDATRAVELLEVAVPIAESVDDLPVLAQTLAYLARGYMRIGENAKSIEAADRALVIAERLNLDVIAAEALNNKGSSLMNLGRRRESNALLFAALEIAEQHGPRSLEMRIRNNLAATLGDDDPARATSLAVETLRLAREQGDKGMFNWVISTVAFGLFDEGRDWDEHLDALHEALERSTIPFERLRLMATIGVFDTARGERLDELHREMLELIPDDAGPEQRLMELFAAADVAIARGDFDTAYHRAIEATAVPSQSEEVALYFALRAATWNRSHDQIRDAVERIQTIRLAGANSQAMLVHANATLAASEGRIRDAVAGFVDARARMLALKLRFAAARIVVDAAVLLPTETEIRGLAAETRPLLVALRARPYLARIDDALARLRTPSGGSPA
jgi:tetratricopeptide (TPR) repeat protein